MKNNMMKKLLTLVLAGAMTLSLAACGAKDPQPDSGTDGSTPRGFRVAIIKQLDHASLDEIANAVAAELDQLAQTEGVKIEYEITSGQGDQTILKQLADQAIADGVDAIVPIATTAAQIAALSAEETKTPVVYAAISDPETAKLTGIDYVTGTSDALNTEFIMDMMFAQNPNVAKVGLLYSLNEPNSAKPIADAKAYLDAKGITYIEQTANTNDEVVAAASALIAASVDAVFTPTDNVIMAAEMAIAEDLAANGIPHYTGADSFVRNGAYATEIVGRGHEVGFGIQIVGRMSAEEVGVGEGTELSAFHESLDLGLNGTQSLLAGGAGGDGGVQLGGLGRIGLKRGGDVDEVESVQMIEVHHVIMQSLHAQHQVADQRGIAGQFDLHGVFQRAGGRQSMGIGAHAAGTGGEELGVARIAALENGFQSAEQGGAASGVLDPAVFDFHLDAEMALDTGERIHHDGSGIGTLGSSFCFAHDGITR